MTLDDIKQYLSNVFQQQGSPAMQNFQQAGPAAASAATDQGYIQKPLVDPSSGFGKVLQQLQQAGQVKAQHMQAMQNLAGAQNLAQRTGANAAATQQNTQGAQQTASFMQQLQQYFQRLRGLGRTPTQSQQTGYPSPGTIPPVGPTPSVTTPSQYQAPSSASQPITF